MENFASCVASMYSLHYLDISANKLTAGELTVFLSQIHRKEHLRTLKLGYNSSTSAGLAPDEPDPFIQELTGFIHHSDSLLHLDISGMSFTFEGLQEIARWGLRKSRTLLSCHMSGLGLHEKQLDEIREILKIKERTPTALKQIDHGQLRAIFSKTKKVQSKNDFFAGGVQK